MKELNNNSLYEKHLFVSDTNLMTDNFCQALIAPASCTSIELSQIKLKPSVIWLQLSSASNVGHQISHVKAFFPDVPLIVMSNIPNDLEALASFSMAARGYCNVHSGASVLKNITNVVMQGGIWIGESIMSKLLSMPPADHQFNLEEKASWSSPLTSREKQVANAIAVGASNKEIAEEMSITERTVKAHVGAVLEKLHLRNRLQLALLVKER